MTFKGGRSPWLGEDAYQSQMTDYERRVSDGQLTASLRVSVSGTPVSGIRILTTGTTYTLPLSYAAPLTLKNATGGNVTVYPPSGSTLYTTAAGVASLVLANGDKYTFAYYNNVWYTI